MHHSCQIRGFATTAAVALLLSCPSGLHAQGIATSPASLRLEDLLDEVRTANPSLRAARFGAEALATRSDQVSALPDPMVMITYQPYPLLTARGTQRTQWRVEQPIPYPGKLALRGQIAQSGAEAAAYQTDAFALDLAVQVKLAYYELYRIQEQQALIRAFQERLRNFEKDAAVQYTVGTGMQQAILKAQLERNTLSRIDLNLVKFRRSAAESLAQLINRAVPDEEVLSLAVESPSVLAFDVPDLVSEALRRRPERQALGASERRADSQIALAKKAFLPDFGVNVTYFDVGRFDVPPTATGRDALALGASIKVPLQRGRLRARLEEARLQRRQVAAQQEALETSFQTQIADLLHQIQQEQQQLALFQEALIPQAHTTLQATLSSYTTGRTDFLDLLDAERMLFSLQSGYEDTLAQYLKAIARLERALGVSSMEELDTL